MKPKQKPVVSLRTGVYLSPFGTLEIRGESRGASILFTAEKNGPSVQFCFTEEGGFSTLSCTTPGQNMRTPDLSLLVTSCLHIKDVDTVYRVKGFIDRYMCPSCRDSDDAVLTGSTVAKIEQECAGKKIVELE